MKRDIDRYGQDDMKPRRTKFYLNRREGKFLGVCAGIADYTGIDVTWIRVAMVVSVFMTSGTTLLIYPVIRMVADDAPRHFQNDDAEEKKFWQGVRQSPARTTRDISSKFREIDRRLADVETYYTSRNTSLANEIDALR
jgi:phage shock protein C